MSYDACSKDYDVTNKPHFHTETGEGLLLVSRLADPVIVHQFEPGYDFKVEGRNTVSAPAPSDNDWARGYNHLTHGLYDQQFANESIYKRVGGIIGSTIMVLLVAIVIGLVNGGPDAFWQFVAAVRQWGAGE